MTRRPAVIFDRDGTLASVAYCRPEDRSQHAWDRFNAALPFDPVVPVVAALLSAVRPGVARIMVSGRMEGDHPGDRHRRFLVQDWISKHQLPIDLLFMRAGGDKRPDAVVKHEMFSQFIEPRFNVKLVVDDRQSVVDMWRSIGLHVIQVVDPGITPLLFRS